MIGEVARAAGRDVSRETFERIEAYVVLLQRESKLQNLISPTTINTVWQRHVLDSAQLVRLAPTHQSWADIGSGAGLPGVIVAILTGELITLIEPRRLRADFLREVVGQLDLSDRVAVKASNVERIRGSFGVITARAVAPLPKLLEISAHLSTRKTVWILPKGRNARAELAEARRAWQGSFHLEPSITGEDSYIIVGTGVGKKP